MRAPDARNTATVVGAAAAALIAVSPLLGAPVSADRRPAARDDRVALIADGHLLAYGHLLAPKGTPSRGNATGAGIPAKEAFLHEQLDVGGAVPTYCEHELHKGCQLGAAGSGLVRGRLSESTDGRLVAFSSWAFDLVAADSNCTSDVFVRNPAAGLTERVSVATDGGQANGPSWGAKLSRDGRYVTFSSKASNLVANDIDGVADRFRRDLRTKKTRLLHSIATMRPAVRPIPSMEPAAVVTP